MNEATWDIVQQVLVIIIGAVLPPLLVILGNELRKISAAVIAKIEGQMTAEQWALAQEIVKNAVKSAQQMGTIDLIKNEGEAKKTWVVAHVQSALHQRGIQLDIDELSAAIEAAYIEAFGGDKPPAELPNG